MEKLQVMHLAVGLGSTTAFYDSKKHTHPMFLEKTGTRTYSVTLVEGNYSHADELKTAGSFDAVTVSAIVRGHVLMQTPGMTKEGEPESITLSLRANEPD